jgi:hypothetical protein
MKTFYLTAIFAVFLLIFNNEFLTQTILKNIFNPQVVKNLK